jgi:hypothetical protein
MRNRVRLICNSFQRTALPRLPELSDPFHAGSLIRPATFWNGSYASEYDDIGHVLQLFLLFADCIEERQGKFPALHRHPFERRAFAMVVNQSKLAVAVSQRDKAKAHV